MSLLEPCIAAGMTEEEACNIHIRIMEHYSMLNDPFSTAMLNNVRKLMDTPLDKFE